MENIKGFFGSRFGKVLLAVVLVVVIFWAGMEYKAYQI
jgi:hypothetical protein